ncbi:hypothetical protein PIB30_080128 [Stylosanthes scabra]|uniref:Uncharacterized protein n=1 Tax=Stylosanthes scabra TaxID=79078 RepID=A0ABU6UV22_9FABA|nr:hypothetical protein [Stylosanthes scabra]
MLELNADLDDNIEKIAAVTEATDSNNNEAEKPKQELKPLDAFASFMILVPNLEEESKKQRKLRIKETESSQDITKVTFGQVCSPPQGP